MKKIALVFIVCVVMMLYVSLVHAADNIVESPDVKIVIEGRPGTYTDVPVNINGRILLPLRAVLNNLGVDNRDILWNSSERSVTVIKGSAKIYLKVESTTAYVNDVPVTLDVAPMIYAKNNRTYIPARFVAQSLGKKVVWDGPTKSAFIREEKDYNRIKDLLDKSGAAMSATDKIKFDMHMKANVAQAIATTNMNVDIGAEIDKQSKRMHMNMTMGFLGQNMGFDTYLANNAVYSQDPSTGKWSKQSLTAEDYEKLFEESDGTGVLVAKDALCAGLVEEEDDPASDKILLKGDVSLDAFMEQISKNVGTGRMNLEKVYLEVSIDRATGMADKLHMEMSGTMEVAGQDAEYSAEIDETFSSLDEGFEITLPKDMQ